MGRHEAVSNGSQTRFGAEFLVGAVASGALVAAALGVAGTAHATCVSVNGNGIGAGCTSTPTSFALALGNGATAEAQGRLNGAISVGTDAETTSTGVGNLAVAVGNPGLNGSVMQVVPTDAIAKGSFNRAFAFGNGSGSAAVGTTTRRFLWAMAATRSRPAVSPHHLCLATTTLP